MKKLTLFLLLLSGCVMTRPDTGGWKLVVLGIAQDGGMPHLGCQKPPCTDVRAGKRRPEPVSCIGIRNTATGEAYIFDATPDMDDQIHMITDKRQPDGVFLTHAHIGHYTGLMYFGKETLGAKKVPVHCSRRMADFLGSNGPWDLLVKDERIALNVFEYDKAIELPGGVKVTAFRVPHREEYTDAVGFRIEGPRTTVVFIPDIDKWEKWDRDIRDYANDADLLFVDGTFGSMEELPHRDISRVPHPLMSETRELLGGTRAKLWFIHLNHSNPAILGGEDVARTGMEFDL